MEKQGVGGRGRWGREEGRWQEWEDTSVAAWIDGWGGRKREVGRQWRQWR